MSGRRSYNFDPRIENWLEMVESGRIRACREQKALCKLICEIFSAEDVYTDSAQLDAYLNLAKYFGYPRLFEWQEFLFALHICTYKRIETLDVDDINAGRLPRFPDLFCLQGRGGGKDGTIALESVCLASPYNGIAKYNIDICAINEDQATRPVKDIVEAFEKPSQIKKLRRHFYWTRELVQSRTTKSIIKGHTNNHKGKDGLRSGVVIFNEYHAYENYANVNVFTTGLGKVPHPRRSYYTTDGDVREGPLDDMKDHSHEILFGGEPDGGLLPFICKLDSEDEVDDPENWEMAVPGLRYLPSLRAEIEKEYADWKRSPARLPAFMSKRFNLPRNDSAVAVTDYENIKATKRELPNLDGMSCTVGIDYASLRDFASVNAHFRTNHARYDINHTWVNKNSPDLREGRIKAPLDDWAAAGHITMVDAPEIPPSLIAEYIAELAKRYFIVGVALDSFRYALLARSLGELGFDTASGNLKLLRPNDIMKIQPVIDSVFTNHGFVWGDRPPLRWAANNTKLVRRGKAEGEDTGNFYYAKIESKSRKTDPFMALVASMAIEDRLGETYEGELPDIDIII